MSTMKTITQAFDTAGSAFTTVGVDLGPLLAYSTQIDFVGAALAGTGKVQVSNTDVQYIDVGVSQTIVSGASIMLSTATAGYRYARVVWTPSAGSGTAAATTILKG